MNKNVLLIRNNYYFKQCRFVLFSGLPKPAVINQWKASAMTNNMQIINFNENDIAYAVTPLYHSAATTLSLFNVIGQGMEKFHQLQSRIFSY